MDKRLKICFCVSALGYGGVERVVSVLSNEMCKQGHCVSVLAIADKSEGSAYPLDRRITLRKLFFNDYPVFVRTILRVNGIRREIKALNPDMVIAFDTGTNMSILFSLLMTNRKIIISERCDPMLIKSKWKRCFRDTLYLRTNGIVYQTVSAKEYYVRLTDKKNAIIYNPINLDKFPVIKYNNAHKNIVSVGRLSPEKNYHLSIEVMHRLLSDGMKVKWYIYGDGSLQDELDALIHKYRLESSMFLMGTSNQIGKELEKADCFVLSSHYEGLPNALIEAMVMGIPCIATDCPCGGPRELIQNRNNGLLVKNEDPEELCSAIKEILYDTELSDHISRNCIRLRDKVEVGYIVMQWMDFIGEVMDEKRHNDYGGLQSSL